MRELVSAYLGKSQNTGRGGKRKEEEMLESEPGGAQGAPKGLGRGHSAAGSPCQNAKLGEVVAFDVWLHCC